MMIRPCRKAATSAMSRWVILSLQPLLSQGPSLYWARRRATLAQSYLLIKRHVLCSNVRQATRYCFVKDACLLPQNAAIICKLLFFRRFSMLYSNVCAFCRLFARLMEFLHSAGDLSVAARCNPLCFHKLFICNFVTDIGQRLVAPSVTFGSYASPQVAQYDVPTVFQARKIRTYHKIRHSLANSTLVWHAQSQFHNSLFRLSYQWLGQHHFTASVGIFRDSCSSTLCISYTSDICCHVGRTNPFTNVLELSATLGLIFLYIWPTDRTYSNTKLNVSLTVHHELTIQ